jgi:hypothetical protein
MYDINELNWVAQLMVADERKIRTVRIMTFLCEPGAGSEPKAC